MDTYCNFNTAAQQKNGHYEPSFEKEQLKDQLLLNIRSCLLYLLPRGTFRGDKFYVGSIRGEKGKSLVVETRGEKIGFWHDFATGDGGDIIDLWAAIHGKSVKTEFHDVMASIDKWLGIREQSNAKKTKKLDQFIWNYLDENGQVIVEVSRHDTPKGKKYLPFDVKKSSYGTPDPRPLYNIPGILKSDKIILVEGEKCAEALIEQGITATTAMSGANAHVDKTNWSPLKGKHVVVWPDNDEPGKKYSERAAKKLLDLGVESLSTIKIPQDKPQGWDAADGIEEGMNIEEFIINNKSPYEKPIRKLKTIDTRAWTNVAPERKWIIKDWLPVGSVTALYGDGGVGKSLLAQQLMTAASIGKPWLGIDIEQTRAYGVFCEDEEEELWRRQCAINEFYQLDMESSYFHDNICLSSRTGKNNLLMVFNNKDTGKLTSYFEELLEDIEWFQPKLVVLDTAADLFGGNENDRFHVRQFIQNCCGQIAQAIKGAVLLCAHPSDSGIMRKTGTGGSTAWNNSVRSRWYLSRPEKADAPNNERILCRKKSNYSAAEQDKILFYWQSGSFIESHENCNSDRVIRDNYNKKLDLERLRRQDIILELIASEAYKGEVYTAAQFAKCYDGKLGLGSDRSIRERINHLAALGYIKFFKGVPEYKLSNTKSKFGYLCVKDMEFKISKDKYTLIKPSYYLSPNNGVSLPVENPDVWVIHNPIKQDGEIV